MCVFTIYNYNCLPLYDQLVSHVCYVYLAHIHTRHLITMPSFEKNTNNDTLIILPGEMLQR
jgi:hypothetical protein